MSKKDSNYVKFLEQATLTRPESPVDKIRDWDGKGDLQTRLQHKDLDALMDRITGSDTDGDEEDALTAGETVKESKTAKKKASPLAMLEGKKKSDFKFKSDSDFGGIDEDIQIDEKESEMLRRLIKEMESIDQNGSLSDIDALDGEEDDFSDEAPFAVDDEFADEETYDDEDLPEDYVEPEGIPEDSDDDTEYDDEELY